MAFSWATWTNYFLAMMPFALMLCFRLSLPRALSTETRFGRPFSWGRLFAAALFCATVLRCLAAPGTGATITKILDNGDDAKRMVLVIMGDGYAAQDQQKYQDDVARLVTNGLLTDGFYSAYARALNIYRVDLVSRESGVSTLHNVKDTALRMIYSGDWERCWMEESTDTESLVTAALGPITNCEHILLILNEPCWGGCSRGMRLCVTSGITWDVVAHEYGHSIGGLYDEYWKTNTAVKPGDPAVNDRNASSLLDRNRVAWATLIDPATPVPTVFDSSMDSSQTIGLFEGGNYIEKGMYRPVYDCRMRTTSQPFCPVCTYYMGERLGLFLTNGVPAGTDASPAAAGVSSSEFRGSNHSDHALAPGAPASTYLYLLVSVTDGASAEVLKVAEVKGSVAALDQPLGGYAYEVSTTERILAAEALPYNPMIERSIADRSGKLMHHFGHNRSTTIPVKVPAMSMSTLPTADLRLRLYRFEPNTKIPSLSATNIQSLVGEKKLKLQYDYSRPNLRQQIIDRYQQQQR